MANLVEEAMRIYDGIRRSAQPLHLVARRVARISVGMYAKLKRFELPPDQPYNFRYLTGMYEWGTTTLVKRLLKPGMVAIDVGAHVGYYTRLFSQIVGGRGKVYAFEPNPETFAVLKRNTATLPNVYLFNAAVLDVEKMVTIYESANLAASSVWPLNTRGDPIGSNLVRALSIDTVLGGIEAHLVKIDVEGSELEVLRGMRDLVRRSHSIALIVEYNPSCLIGRGLDGRLLLDTIRVLGFEISAMDEANGEVERIEHVHDLNQGRWRRAKHVNLLCTKR